jgi:hypothetical protein
VGKGASTGSETVTHLLTTLRLIGLLAIVGAVSYLVTVWLPAWRERRRRKEEDEAPFVCPGCYAVGNEPHAGYCIDAEIEREREDALVDVDCDDDGDIYR